MTRKRRVILSVAVLGAFFAAGFALDYTVRARAPRTAHLSITRSVSGRVGSLQEVVLVTDAIRSDGSTAREILRAVDAPRFRAIREVRDLSVGKVFQADPETQSVVVKAMHPEIVARESAAVTQDCTKAYPGPGVARCEATALSRFGLKLDRMTQEWTEGAKRYKITALLARDLDWKAIEWIVERDGVEVERREVTHLIVGEPSADHFALPVGYREITSLAEMMASSERARGREVAAASLDGVARRETN